MANPKVTGNGRYAFLGACYGLHAFNKDETAKNYVKDMLKTSKFTVIRRRATTFVPARYR